MARQTIIQKVRSYITKNKGCLVTPYRMSLDLGVSLSRINKVLNQLHAESFVILTTDHNGSALYSLNDCNDCLDD